MPPSFYYTIGIWCGTLGWSLAILVAATAILGAIFSKWVFLFCLTFVPIIVAITQSVVDWTIEKETRAREIEWERIRASE